MSKLRSSEKIPATVWTFPSSVDPVFDTACSVPVLAESITCFAVPIELFSILDMALSPHPDILSASWFVVELVAEFGPTRERRCSCHSQSGQHTVRLSRTARDRDRHSECTMIEHVRFRPLESPSQAMHHRARSAARR